MNKILVVEDELDLRDFLFNVLSENGYEVKAVGDGLSAIKEAEIFKPALIILDQNLPDIKGPEILKAIREKKEIINPMVLILTALSQEQYVVNAFDSGADDYVEKPFSVSILLRRIKSLMKRVSSTPNGGSNIFEKNGLKLDCDTYKVKVDEEMLETTLMEFNILKELFKANGKTLTREELIHRISGTTAVTNRTVDVHICSIRKKLNLHGKNIETIRGVGYRLQA